MADIFISYASADRPRAKVLTEALTEAFEQHGWSIWWDRKIFIGNVFDKEIEQALGASRCVVVLWSTASVASEWVREEADEGKCRGILAPVLLENVKIPMGFGRIQTANLTDWQAGIPHLEFDQLVIAIARILQSQPTISAKNTTKPKAAEAERNVRDASIACPKASTKPRSIPDQAASTVTTKRGNGITDTLKRYSPVVAPQGSASPGAGLASVFGPYWPAGLALLVVAVVTAMGLWWAAQPPSSRSTLPKGEGAAAVRPNEAREKRPIHIGVVGEPAQVYILDQGRWEGPYPTPHKFSAPLGRRITWKLSRKGYQDRTGHFDVQVVNEYNYPLCKAGTECPSD